MDGSYIKIDRRILSWEWYKNINTKVLFLHMLLKANWKEGKFEGKIIPRGSFVSSIGTLAKETELTNDEVRTALKHLISTKEITKQSFSKFTVFTVNNYSEYQDVTKQNTNQIPSSSHSIPILFPTIEEKKEIYDDGDDNIAREAETIADNLCRYYWGRYHTQSDVEHVECIIVRLSRNPIRRYIDNDRKGLLEYAFKQSFDAGCMNWKYVHGVLNTLTARGIDTLDKAYEYEAERDMGV